MCAAGKKYFNVHYWTLMSQNEFKVYFSQKIFGYVRKKQ